MGLFSSSSRSSTTNNQTSANAPQQVSDGGNALSFQNVDGSVSVQSIDRDLMDQTFAFSAGALSESLESNALSQDRAFSFAGGAFNAAASSINNALESNESLSSSVIRMSGNETERGREFTAGVIGEYDSFARAMINSNAVTNANALDSNSKISALSLMTVDGAAERNAQFAGEATNAIVGAFKSANRSEVSELSEKVLYGLIAMGALFAYTRWAK